MANWVSINDVKLRLGVAETAKGYGDGDITSRITRAETEIKASLQATLDLDMIAGWDGNTVPPEVATWTADLAAAFVLSDYAGQPLLDKTSQAGSLYMKVQGKLEAVRLGKIEIVDRTNAGVEPVVDLVSSTTEGKSRHYSMNHPDDSSFGEGTLDEW